MPKFKLSQNLVWPLVVVAIAAAAFWLKPWQTKPAETISVSATGKTSVVPNVAQLSASMITYNKNLDEGRKINEKKVTNLVTNLKQLGVQDKDIKTEYISGQLGNEPVRIDDPFPNPNTNVVTHNITVTVRDLEQIDEAIATITKEATNLYGPNLTVADEDLETAKSQARQDAVENAKQKAEELAKLSERKLGRTVKIQEQGDYGYPIPIYAQSETDLREKATSIQPGQNEVTINLLVDFALK